MPWTIFKPPGTPKAAVGYAHSLLKTAHLPQTPQNLQFVFDWEVSEGGGGVNNPLNVGTVAGLADSGSQYGGGAANYPSLSAEIKAVTKELNTPQYKGIKAGLARSTYNAATSALFQSPWAGNHYGYGKNWSMDPFPKGKGTATAGGTAPTTSGGTPASTVQTAASSATSALTGVLGGFFGDVEQYAIRGLLVIFGAILIIVGLRALTDQGKEEVGIPVQSSKPAAGAEGGEEAEEAETAEVAAA